jgi:hypothetical protein
VKRVIVKLMAKLIFLPAADRIESGTYLLYDGACGTGGMLTVAEDTLRTTEREHVRCRDHVYTLRGSESRTLATVGAFRAVPASEFRDAFERSLNPRMASCGTFGTLASLTRSTRTRHDGRHADQRRARSARVPPARRRLARPPGFFIMASRSPEN